MINYSVKLKIAGPIEERAAKLLEAQKIVERNGVMRDLDAPNDKSAMAVKMNVRCGEDYDIEGLVEALKGIEGVSSVTAKSQGDD